MSASTRPFVTDFFDKIEVTYPDSTTEIYTYLLHGTPVEVIEVVYTDSSKASLLSIQKIS